VIDRVLILLLFLVLAFPLRTQAQNVLLPQDDPTSSGSLSALTSSTSSTQQSPASTQNSSIVAAPSSLPNIPAPTQTTSSVSTAQQQATLIQINQRDIARLQALRSQLQTAATSPSSVSLLPSTSPGVPKSEDYQNSITQIGKQISQDQATINQLQAEP
jgi:biopolymer transport protein ExbD